MIVYIYIVLQYMVDGDDSKGFQRWIHVNLSLNSILFWVPQLNKYGFIYLVAGFNPIEKCESNGIIYDYFPKYGWT